MAGTTGAAKRRYRSEEHSINARDVRFDFRDVPMHYIPGEVLATHIVNVMHLVLPEGERAMAQCLAEAMPYIDDERLKEEVAGFVGQESMHASSHAAAREHLQSLGLDVETYVNAVSWLVDRILGDHGLTGRAKRAWLNERLGLFAGMEHYTAVIGEWLLENPRFEELGMDPAMMDLVRWHGAEEVEHRSVVFDAYMYMDGGYARRARTAVLASATLLPLFIFSTAYMYRRDPERTSDRSWVTQFVSATVRGVIPPATVFFTELPRYLKPGFHPSQLGPMDKALRYLAHSPAARVVGQ
ncbi:metal-dependent hydrolase [Aldersonia kunmingensis]|uniref:metal-dependent hydrolase n=1 Tax=Aldersonia kunmingensis TaxID=408066 RepID=UPI00082C1FF8|nr:metal-dependent hydrolase [Aldersonia kunmingensis]